MDGSIRIGYVSSVNYETGMVRVYYPDREITTAEFPYFSFCGEYRMPKVQDMVLVLHLTGDSSSGVVLGKYWNQEDLPPVWGDRIYNKEMTDRVYERCKEGDYLIHADTIRFESAAGTISVSELIQLKNRE